METKIIVQQRIHNPAGHGGLTSPLTAEIIRTTRTRKWYAVIRVFPHAFTAYDPRSGPCDVTPLCDTRLQAWRHTTRRYTLRRAVEVTRRYCNLA